jgi:hypothetical protein
MRRHYFVLFYLLHYSFIAFYVFVALHTSPVFPYLIAAGIVYVVDRVNHILMGSWPQMIVTPAVLTSLALEPSRGDTMYIPAGPTAGVGTAAGFFETLIFLVPIR